jgi:TRAP transporter TAXI family solute receptor
MAKAQVLLRVAAVALASVLLQACASLGTPPQSNDFGDKLMLLGSGAEGGSFAPIGKAVCEAMNEARKQSLVRCLSVQSTGSLVNIHAVAAGTIQLGFGQEDLAGQAYADNSPRGGRALRAVALMHHSPIGIVVRRASGIRNLDQIAQGVLNRGQKGSGMYANAEVVLTAMGLQDRDFKGVTSLAAPTLVQAFCAGEIDVIFDALAHPSQQYRQLMECGGELLDIPPPLMQRMLAASPWLKPMDIPAGLYRSDQPVVKTLGMRNLLLTRADVDAEAIFRVAVLLRQQHAALQAQEPLLTTMRKLSPQDLDGLSVPLHPGARRALAVEPP